MVVFCGFKIPGRTRLTFFFFIIATFYSIYLVASLFVMSRLYYKKYAEENSNQMRKSMMITEQHVYDTLSSVVENMQLFSYSRSTIRFLKGGPEEKLLANWDIVTALNSITGMNKFINKTYLYTQDGPTVSSSTARGSSSDAYGVYWRVLSDYASLLHNSKTSYIYTKSYKGLIRSNRYFAILIPIYEADGVNNHRSHLGTFVALCNVDVLGEMLNPGIGNFYILEENGSLLFPYKTTVSDDVLLKAIDMSYQDTIFIDNLYYSAKILIRNVDWNLICLYSTQSIFSSFGFFFQYVLAISGIVIIMQIIIWILLYRNIAIPIIVMAKQVQEIDVNNRTLITTKSRYYELTQLINYINNTIERIALMSENILKEQEKTYQYQNSQLKLQILFLQSQINPHFLYNILGEIRGMAAVGNVAQIRKAALNLANIYRYCNSANHLSSVKQELDMVRSYLQLMCTSYPERYKLLIDAEERTLSATIPKMILQPIVENSLTHGFHDSKKQGCVNIHCEIVQDSLFITVSDDGNGMDDLSLSELSQNLVLDNKGKIETSSQIGIRNVNQRIRLIYGEQCGISISHNHPNGLIVRLFTKITVPDELMTIDGDS